MALTFIPRMQTDTRSGEEFLRELETVRDMPLAVQLRFMRNKQNRDRAICVSKDKLSRILSR